MKTSLPRFATYCAALLCALLLCARPAHAHQIIPPPPPPPPPPSLSAPTVTSAPASASQAQPATATAPSRYRITGVVVNSVTRSPVPRAELSVARMSGRRANGRNTGRQQSSAGAALTDATGHFEIEVPSAGGWSLTASARGYHTQAFDAHDGFSTAIVLTEAAPVFDLTFPLPPSSAIEGYVVDEAGEPVRDAQLTVSLVPPATPDDAHPRPQVRGTQRTDDRGYYKLPGLPAGSYSLRLQAQPWYATGASNQRFSRFNGGIRGVIGSIGLGNSSANANPNNAPSAPDPLDVVYPLVWYPGVTDATAASPIALRPGEVREADFHLSPIPGFHLHIPAEAPPAADTRRPVIQGGSYLTQVLPDGSEAGISSSVRTDAQGNTDFSGLAPGTYLIHRNGEFGNNGTPATIQISPNSARIVDATQSSSATQVTVKIDPAGDLPALQVLFRDLETGKTSFVLSQNAGVRGQRPGGHPGQSSRAITTPDASAPPDPPAARSVSLQPGRYEVSLSGIGDLHLTGIEATGAQATGRTVTIGGGAPTLMLHVASGRASVTGFVRSQGVPVAGAMVLLVPATLGDPSGLDFTRRDQSNTDGSFDILDVLPGTYILVAVDRGWDINWRDPATLRSFLMHGLPLDLTSPGDRKETIEAQSP